jgi:hypothetical protein
VLDLADGGSGGIGVWFVQAAAHSGYSEQIAEEAGATEVYLSLGECVKEHGGCNLDGFGIFQRREMELVLDGIGASDHDGIFAALEDGLLILRILEVAALYDLARGERAVVFFVKAEVEVAERFAVQCGRLAPEAIGFEVAADGNGESIGHARFLCGVK